MDRDSLRRFRRLEKDILRTEKAYVHDLMEVMDFKGEAEFEEAIEGFKAALRGEENKRWEILRALP